MRVELEPFVERVPWLRDLGDEMLRSLDASEWHLPSDAAVQRRQELEAQIPALIMTYRPEAQGLSDGLHTLIEPAPLTEDQAAAIREAEAMVGECLFVAYMRPLKRRERGSRARKGRRPPPTRTLRDET